MSELCKRKDITFIQGDILETYFELIGIEPQIVKAVYFSCRKADLRFPCPYSKIHSAYCLRLGSNCTKHLTPGISSYDLTLEFVDGNCITLLHECSFIVLKKRNTITEEEEDDGST